MVVTLSGKWVAAAPPAGASASIFQWNTAWGGSCGSCQLSNPANYLVIIRDAQVEFRRIIFALTRSIYIYILVLKLGESSVKRKT